jgi:hypothetical protein
MSHGGLRWLVEKNKTWNNKTSQFWSTKEGQIVCFLLVFSWQ